MTSAITNVSYSGTNQLHSADIPPIIPLDIFSVIVQKLFTKQASSSNFSLSARTFQKIFLVNKLLQANIQRISQTIQLVPGLNFLAKYIHGALYSNPMTSALSSIFLKHVEQHHIQFTKEFFSYPCDTRYYSLPRDYNTCIKELLCSSKMQSLTHLDVSHYTFINQLFIDTISKNNPNLELISLGAIQFKQIESKDDQIIFVHDRSNSTLSISKTVGSHLFEIGISHQTRERVDEILGICEKLERLSLSGTIHDIEHMDLSKTQIQVFDLSKCTNAQILPKLPVTAKVLCLPDLIYQLPGHIFSLPIEELRIGLFNDTKEQFLALLQNNKNIKSLRISGFIEELPNLAEYSTIEILDLTRCNFLAKINELPATLKELYLPKNSSFLTTIPDLSLTKLKIIDIHCSNITKLSALPATLEKLTLNMPIENISDLSHTKIKLLNLLNCVQLKTIPKVPATLKKLFLPESIEELPDLSHTHIETLLLFNCINLKKLPKLPVTLKELSLSHSIEELSDLFQTQIQELNFYEHLFEGYFNIKKIPSLPSTLTQFKPPASTEELPDLSHTQIKVLNLSECSNLKTLPLLSPTLKILHLPKKINSNSILSSMYEQLKVFLENNTTLTTLSYSPTMEQLPEIAHTMIEELDLILCSKLKTIPTPPPTLKKLFLPNSIEELPDLSHTNIEELVLSSCKKLKKLPRVPATLKILILPDSIEELPDLSHTHLEVLNVSVCSKLKTLPQMPPTLKLKK